MQHHGQGRALYGQVAERRATAWRTGPKIMVPALPTKSRTAVSSVESGMPSWSASAAWTGQGSPRGRSRGSRRRREQGLAPAHGIPESSWIHGSCPWCACRCPRRQRATRPRPRPRGSSHTARAWPARDSAGAPRALRCVRTPSQVAGCASSTVVHPWQARAPDARWQTVREAPWWTGSKVTVPALPKPRRAAGP